MDEARHHVARLVGGTDEDIVFTSGGTEGNNLVINTAVEHFRRDHADGSVKPHVVTTNLEHDSVAYVLNHLREKGVIELTVVKASVDTCAVAVDEMVAALTGNTCLVTVMLANNETGCDAARLQCQTPCLPAHVNGRGSRLLPPGRAVRLSVTQGDPTGGGNLPCRARRGHQGKVLVQGAAALGHGAGPWEDPRGRART